jgi:hypothetical protein
MGLLFKGVGPDGKPATFRFAEGRWYHNICPDCGKENGGGIEREGTTAGRTDDPYSPTNAPCIWCGNGPMVVEYEAVK